MPVNIHSTVLGEGAPVVLIHGLFGMGSNLGGLAKSLADRYRVYSVDLPNHGRSGWQSPASISAYANTLGQWMDAQELSNASFMGHSLGGKVAMELALDSPGRVDALVVADIAPVTYSPGHTQEFAALEAVASAACDSRAMAAGIMGQFLEDDGVVQFLLKNLVRADDGRYRWRFNLAELIASYDAIRGGLTSSGPFSGRTVFIKGENSDYIRQSHRETIMALFPAAQLKVIPDSGHWLNVEQPRLFNSVVGRFFDRR